MLVRIMILFITFLLLSCSFEPWKTVRYVNIETENIIHRFDSLPDESQYKINYLNGAFVDIVIVGKDATVYSSKEPYAIFIFLTGKSDEHINFTIHNINILTSKGINYTETIQDLPIIIDFKTINLIPPNYNYIRGKYTTDYIYNFNDDEIYISLILDVLTEEKSEEKEMFFTLTKKIKRGLFQSYW